MKPAQFEYVSPSTIDAAIAALVASNGEGKVLAGGQSLLPLLNFRMARPAVLVDLNGIDGLSYIEDRGDRIAIGALARHRELEHSLLIASKLPVMSAAMRHVAHLAIRNRGTIGGSLSHADPAAELPMLATFYEAEISVQGPSGRRTIAAGNFFVDALTNCLEPEEIVVEVEFPVLKQDGWAFEEVARRFGDFALASIAVSVRRGPARLEAARVAVMGVADTPRRLREAEDELVAMALDDTTPDRFAEIVVSLVAPNDDLHASADYRKHLLAQLARRALRTALAMKG
ncbi:MULTISPECIES: FAD binding domain-containing protein [Bradyrhizobium]|uniref:Xanthine dehydrogenase family protein subunit M n=1 Tax=Bradyrhizobium elkanii TaxID=29448 RepID=A0A4U6RZZ2_BRAEL|nr:MULTISPECIES: FAD binding domain-containing protein [Bradyrhizobium]MTV14069.1 xanthine dehydrogenase family protein subunit M [Bradyrhizobium sp. BR2003]TKV80380.1 xanthine dehydrogenase family protein subunit M [Bradyrhizobium elkanii]